jgi:hypothetical protein
MLIERDRYLDDTANWHISLALQSRSLKMHSLLTALTIEERRAVSDVLARALNDVIAILHEKVATTESGSQS